MIRKLGLMLMGVAGALLFLGASAAEDKKPATIKEVMKKVNGKTGVCKKCSDLGKDMKWEDAEKVGKELKQYGVDLGKNKPKKGDADSWEKLSKKYAEQTNAIYEAAEKKDSAALDKSVKAFTGSCKACHDAHK